MKLYSSEASVSKAANKENIALGELTDHSHKKCTAIKLLCDWLIGHHNTNTRTQNAMYLSLWAEENKINSIKDRNDKKEWWLRTRGARTKSKEEEERL